MPKQKKTNKFSRKLDFMLDLAQKNSQHQDQVFTGHVTNINTLLALEGLTIAIFVEGVKKICLFQIFSDTTTFLQFLGFILLFSSIFCALAGLLCKDFKHKPANKYIYTSETLEQNLDEYKEDTIADLKDGYEHNREQLRKIANWIDRSITLYVVGLFVIALALLKI